MNGVDFHQHVWPDPFRRALERRVEAPRLRGRRLILPRGGESEIDVAAYTPEARLAELDRNGLAQAIVSLPPTTEPTPDLVEIWNESAAELPDRLVPLGYESAASSFAGAIVAAPDLRRADCIAPLLDRLEQDGKILFVHPGPAATDAPWWWTAGIGYTAQLQEAYAAWLAAGSRRWPTLKVVFALLAGGAPFQIERLVRRGLEAGAPFAADVWFETSSYGERAIELALQTFGAERLLFGSDAPIDPTDEARSIVARFGPALERQLLESGPRAVLAGGTERCAA